MITASEISRQLAAKAEDVCQLLLPQGARKRQEWVAGNIHGGDGDSLKVKLSGEKAGVWCDFADSSLKGDLIDLWIAVKGIGLKEALTEAKEYLGIKDDGTRTKHHLKKDRKPVDKSNIRVISNAQLDYLVNERMLSEQTVSLFKVACDANGSIAFPYFDEDDSLVMIKYLALDRSSGKKKIFTSAEPVKCLFGKNACDIKNATVIITEGEIDAMSLRQLGYNAVSVPFGAKWEASVGGSPNDEWIAEDYGWLAKFSKIILFLDQDDCGKKAVTDIIKRLGRERCYVVETEHGKDANEMLVNGKVEHIRLAIEESKTIDPASLKHPQEFRDDIVREMLEANNAGIDFPLGVQFKVRRGELTLWTGYSGHGKALALDTKIPTPEGWSTMGDLKRGDMVFDENGNACNVVAVTEVMLNRPCYKVKFSDGTEIIADEQHEWLTDTCQSRTSKRNAKKNEAKRNGVRSKKATDQSHKRTHAKIRTTKEIAETLVVSSGGWIGHTEHSVMVCGSLKTNDIKFDIDPYVLGAWLGDGTTACSVITNPDIEIIDQIRSYGHNVNKLSSKYGWGITGGLQTLLRKNGLLGNKHIPKQYLRASEDQRLALLQGLMDTDGHITDYGRCEFCSTNENIAYGCLELVLSLGMQARILTGRAMLYGKDCGPKFRVTFTPNKQVFRLKRKADFVKKDISDRIKHRFIVSCDKIDSVPVKCIEVDSESHLYLASEAMIPTHNSSMLLQTMLHMVTKGEKVCITSLEVPPHRSMMIMVYQYMRLNNMTAEHVDTALSEINDNIWLICHVGSVKWKALIEEIKYAHMRYGIMQFSIDSLLKCGISGDDYNQQKEFVDALTEFVNDTGCHVHLVAHSRKGMDESGIPTKMDLKGSGDISDLCFNGLTVWRNKEKEEKMRELQDSKDYAALNQWAAKPDAIIKFWKQRYGDGSEPFKKLFYLPQIYSFTQMDGKG